MKKILFMVFLLLFIAACNNNNENADDSTDNNSNDETETEEESDGEDEEGNESKEVYQVGDTADITSNSYGFPYQVTLNSVELTADEVDGLALEDLNYSAEEGGKFLVANVTIKNTGDSPITPKEQLSAQLYGEDTPTFSSEDQPFSEREEELAPGEEITGNLVYTDSEFEDYDVFYLTYEAEAIEDETRFEIPIPNE